MDHKPAQGQGNKPGGDQQTSYSHWQHVSRMEKNHLEGLPAISEKVDSKIVFILGQKGFNYSFLL